MLDSTPSAALNPADQLIRAQMAELVDALASGASVRMDVEVRVLFWAPIKKPFVSKWIRKAFCFCERAHPRFNPLLGTIKGPRGDYGL